MSSRTCERCGSEYTRPARSRTLFCSPSCARHQHIDQQRTARGPAPAGPARLAAEPGYESLALVLDEALADAQFGKGLARHASGEPFHDQQIVQFGEWMGNTGFAVGQACKKAIESTRLDATAARAELLGAINYLAAAVIVINRRGKP